MRNASPEELRRFASGIFKAHGAIDSNAATVAASLVKASLLGHDSHGIFRVGRYVEKVQAKTLDPAATPTVAKRHGATAVVDGQLGFGSVAAKFGAELAIDTARKLGIAAVSLSRTNHIGRLAEYAERISGEGMIALIFSAGAGPGGSVAPFGGRERIFGTNPIAWGLPVPVGRGPLVADFSTSAIPEGKLAMAHGSKLNLPEGSTIDRDGRPTTNPADFYNGGALLPFGGHKGYSLVLLVEVMASLLAGAPPVSSKEFRPGNPTLILAIDIAAFLEPHEYLRHIDDLLKRIESSAPAEGIKEVLVPNTIELGIASARRRTGIPIPDFIWTEFAGLAQAAGIPLPKCSP